ncbi:interferon regulatory factor 5-like [Acanthaster planci]|uniref:Interferon regulatory factor 5-like n=1 Tax=Acanthaster planci TaxID=133434 RepID=A0A8B7YIC3_ACAPL|nr:interferon regulatory factor 5-like [Acanthaster planci]
MISGGISQQPDLLQFSLATIDQSQLQEDLSPSTLPSNTSESMSIDSTQVSGSIAAVKTVAKSSPKKGGVKTKGEEEMEQKPRVDEVPQLPDVKELLVRIRYRSKEVVRDHIKNSKGCLAFYNKPWDFQVPHENCPAGVQFPDITNEEEEGMTESQFKFTKQVLAALEKGLFLRCDDYGNVYATRFCRSKIFWYSTEKGPIADAEMSRSTPTVTFQKLERNKEVMVFDNMLFQKKLLHYVINKPTFQKEQTTNKHTIPISPAIFFTFAQSWNPLTSALSSCLVSMVVNPVKARMQRQWGNEDRHESYDLSNYRAQISSQSGLHMPEPNVTSMKN